MLMVLSASNVIKATASRRPFITTSQVPMGEENGCERQAEPPSSTSAAVAAIPRRLARRPLKRAKLVFIYFKRNWLQALALYFAALFLAKAGWLQSTGLPLSHAEKSLPTESEVGTG